MQQIELKTSTICILSPNWFISKPFKDYTTKASFCSAVFKGLRLFSYSKRARGTMMARLINPDDIDLIINAVEASGFKVTDTWWRDGDLITQWWLDQNLPLEKLYAAPVSCGEGLVAWLQLSAYDPAYGMIWSVISIARDEGLPALPVSELLDDGKLGIGHISMWTARRILRVLPKDKSPCVPGCWVAVTFPSYAVELVKCVKATKNGYLSEYLTNRGEIVEYEGSECRNFWKLDNRDHGLQALWDSGRTRFEKVIVFRNAYNHEEKKFLKTIGLDLKDAVDFYAGKITGRAVVPKRAVASKPAEKLAEKPTSSAPAKPAERTGLPLAAYNGGRYHYRHGRPRDWYRLEMPDKSLSDHWEAGWDDAMTDDLI